MRYSRSVKSGRVYLSSTAVCVSEILKILTCFVVLWRQMDNSVIKLIAELRTELVLRWTDSLKLTVPAILYTVQNNLLFIALSYLDAATYQVCYHFFIQDVLKRAPVLNSSNSGNIGPKISFYLFILKSSKHLPNVAHQFNWVPR